MPRSTFPTHCARWVIARGVALYSSPQAGECDGKVPALQVLIYNAFQWRTPVFAHVSLILAPDKSKLSKRHGATSVGEYREQGCLAPAMVNFLSLLGWNDGTEQELFTREELQQKFSLDRLGKSGAVFDNTKLVRISRVSESRTGGIARKGLMSLGGCLQMWMNGQYIKQLPVEDAVKLLASQWTSSQILAK